jgi:hypothetical protein
MSVPSSNDPMKRTPADTIQLGLCQAPIKSRRTSLTATSDTIGESQPTSRQLQGESARSHQGQSTTRADNATPSQLHTELQGGGQDVQNGRAAYAEQIEAGGPSRRTRVRRWKEALADRSKVSVGLRPGQGLNSRQRGPALPAWCATKASSGNGESHLPVIAARGRLLRDCCSGGVCRVRTLEEHRQWRAWFGEPYEPTPDDLPEST